MSWLSVSFEVGAQDLEALTDALLEAGALAVDVADAAAGSRSEEPVYAEGVTDPRPWTRNVVTILLASDADARAVVGAACTRAGVEIPACRAEVVPERDWVRATQSQFAPIHVSGRLWIVPSWLNPPDAEAVNVILDPGVAFGTGSHPTTRQCLRWLERAVAGGETVIDYGSGSGILAIAAMMLGASRAVGIDIDPQALVAARANALQNRVDVEFCPAAAPAGQAADLMVANILAHPLIVLAPVIAGLTARGGRLALAGVLAEQSADVRAAYAEWCALETSASEEGWVLLTGTRI